MCERLCSFLLFSPFLLPPVTSPCSLLPAPGHLARLTLFPAPLLLRGRMCRSPVVPQEPVSLAKHY